MPGTVNVERRGDVAILSLDNPPVNSLSWAMRGLLGERVDEVLADDAVRAIVVAGAGRMFCGGADIREFSAPPPPNAPNLPAILDRIEASPKPVVAGIHFVAAGGGLELALACHVRLAAHGTRLGLTEVSLGIVPGAGGTQRLPRLIGVQAALDVIVGARLHPIERAIEYGFVDACVEGELVDAAVTHARQLADDGTPLRRASQMEEHLDAVRDQPDFFRHYRERMDHRTRGFQAPYAAVDCVETALHFPYADALKHERAVFSRLRNSDQSKAQRHAFFAEREVARIPDVPKETPVRTIDRAAVIGCGTMGGGVAMSLANAGIPVTVIESSQEALDRGMETVRRNYARTVRRGRMTETEMQERLARIAPALDTSAIDGADIVIEAVFEELPLKQEVFRTIDATARPDAILATNTSSLDIDAIAGVTTRPARVIGTHFFSPAHVMRLVETVRGAATSPETIATAMTLAKRLGKVAVVVGNCDSFVGNRMMYAYRRQADFLLEEGASPQQIDRVIREFGLPMGPYEMADLAGLDVSWHIRKRQAADRPGHLRYSPIADRICKLGRFGQKSHAGWYRYEPGHRTPIPDPAIGDVIAQVSADLGVERRTVHDAEIVPRCLYPLVNEGAKILEEGLVLRASDIDVIWMLGYGFPRYRGGPMFWADLVGLGAIHESMQRLHDAHGDWLTPAPLLERLAREGKTFGDWTSTIFRFPTSSRGVP